MTKQIKYSFQITAEQENRIKALPRHVKLAEKLRVSLDKILDEIEAIA